MALKRIGPTLDAGTVIIEKEGEKTITPSALGSTAYVGILERGPIGELITTVGKKDLLAKTGGLIPGSLAPDAAQDFWDHSEGAGTLFLYRVTDGTEVKASVLLWDRKWPRNQVVQVDEKYGGGAGGRRDTYVVDLAAVPGDITAETTIDLPITFHPIQKDQFKGGVLHCTETASDYEIIGNDASDGAAKTELRLAADSTLLTDFGAGTDKEFFIEVTQTDEWGRDRYVSVEVTDGQENPSTEWGLKVYVNDELVKTYPDLSSDPNSNRYFLRLINDDATNYYVTVTDLWVGSITADVRPANFFATVAAGEISEKQIDLATVLVEAVQTGTGGPHTFTAFTYGSEVIKDTYEMTWTAAWALLSLVKQKTHAFPAPVTAVPYPADNVKSFGFTVTNVGPVSGDKIRAYILALVQDELIGGRVFFPAETWAPGQGWSITDNDETTVDITTGDLTNGGTIAGNIKVRLQYRQQLEGGYDGIATIDETDFLPAFDTGGASEFDKLADKGYGLVKFGCPGITALLASSLTSINDAQIVERAGVAYADAKNHQYRLEVPQTGTDVVVARDYIQGVIGKSNYEKVCMHGWCRVSDPILTDRLKTVP